MATASQGNLLLDLGSLERALDKAQRITDQGMRSMQRRVEEAGKKMADALAISSASALDATSSAFGDLRKAYDPAAKAADEFVKSQSALNALLQQNKSVGAEYAQSLDKQWLQSAAQAPASYTDKAGINFPVGDAYGRVTQQSADYATKLDELKAKHSETTQQIQSDYGQMGELLDGWKNGAQSAFSDYMSSANDVAGKTKAVFTSAFQQMDEAILQFATTGKFSFSDFAKSVLKDMAMLAAKTAASSALSSLFGMIGSTVSSLFPSAAPASRTFTVGGVSNVFTPQLDASGVTPPVFSHAKGGVFTNSVAMGPTLAPMALFGEAGPEAIMPLSRGSDGSLGVVALGGGQSGITSNQQVVIQQTINVADGQAGASGAGMNSRNLANAYASAAKQGAAEQIARDLKPGGQIWSVINGR